MTTIELENIDDIQRRQICMYIQVNKYNILKFMLQNQDFTIFFCHYINIAIQ
jgi:hypothetical protein